MQLHPFRELKRTIHGEERIFDCDALAVTPSVAIVRYVFTHQLRVRDRTFEPGGWTEGFFWRRRNYNLYHIVSRDGEPIADRFDVIDHVRISPHGVRYDDLLLDIWRYPDGSTRVEDEDELQAAIAVGLLNASRLATVRRTEALLLRRGHSIVDRALAGLAALRR
jgi:predicted RNA-binding protein associated with RNAse of E/G family